MSVGDFKKKIIDQIIVHLEGLLKVMEAAALEAREAATHEESKAEDKYDTRGLEASYLAGAQAKRAAELKQQIGFYKNLVMRPFGKNAAIAPTALVELESDDKMSSLFIVPTAGGMSIKVDDKFLQIVSPDSVLGGELIGKVEGDVFEAEIAQRQRTYKINSVK